MNRSRWLRTFGALLVLSLTMLAMPLAQASIDPGKQVPDAVQMEALAALPGVNVRWDYELGTPKMLIRYGGVITPPSDLPAEQIARSFLLTHGALFKLGPAAVASLEVAKQYASRHNGVTQLSFRQVDQGRWVFGSQLGFTIDRVGQIVTVGGRYFPGAFAAGVPAIGPDGAIRLAAASVGARAPADLELISAEPGPSKLTLFENTIAKKIAEPHPLRAELVTYADAETAKLAWLTDVESGKLKWDESLIDATSGDVLFQRTRWQDSGSQGNVFTQQHPGITGASQSIVSFPAGWVADDTTTGNNVDAYQDLNGDDSADYRPTTPAPGDPAYQHFNYTFTNAYGTGPTPGTDVTTDRDAVVTQLFYLTNLYHDHTYALGFDEASGNFQQDNFGLGGVGGDPVLAEADWDFSGGSCCNAFFATPADGGSGIMQMLVGMPPGNQYIQRAMNGDTVFHEASHGLSNRLVGDGTMGSGAQTDGMGEGWGDFFATSFWNDPVYGDYNNGNTTSGIRGVAYNNSSLVYSDLCSGGCQEHSDGEIWATVLWDLRTAFIARLADHSSGVQMTEQLVVDGMKGADTSPTFLDARDAILAADVTNNSGTYQCLIWGVFAGREMGFSANSASQSSVSGATDGPSSCVPTANIGGPYLTPEGTDILLDATGSSDANGDPLTYEWDLDNDGDFDDATGPTYLYTQVGTDAVKTIGLKVSDPDGFSDESTTTLTITNVLPSLSVVSDGTEPEGSAFTIDIDATDPGWLDDLSGTVDWGPGLPVAFTGTKENVRPDASLQAILNRTYGDNGNFTVQVCVSDDDGFTCEAHAVSISNVAPTVTLDASQVTAALENGSISTLVSFTDPGWEDTYTYSIDWGVGPAEVGVPVMDVEGPPQDEGHVSSSFTYGDNGLFTVMVTISDDDAGSSATSFDVTVENVDPTAVIDESGATSVNGVPTIISDVGVPVLFGASSSDPGSDDLVFAWDWDDGLPSPDEFFTSLVNPPAFDPLPSPSVQPRSGVTDARSHAFTEACLYDVSLSVGDDDLGSAGDSIPVIITAPTGGRSRSQGYWQHQYHRVGLTDFTNEELECYLAITGFMSQVFNEQTDASTIPAAYNVMWLGGNRGSAAEKLDRALLTAWLNFANGSIEYGQLFDTNGDALPDTAFSAIMANAETVRINPASTTAQLDEQRKVVHKLSS